MSINFKLYQNEKGTWCVLFPGTLADMPGNNKLQALNHVACMLRHTQQALEAMIYEETKPNALEKPLEQPSLPTAHSLPVA